jgi:poly-gamma-glutamate capsule biosynthesis protein CapA/YwtB (metallophosphatase superfamily)
MHGPHVMRGMEFYRHRLIAYSMGNFAGYHALQTGGALSVSGILRLTLDARGDFVSGQLVAVQLVAPGVPRLDPGRTAWAQVRAVNRADFPATGATIGSDGTITAG